MDRLVASPTRRHVALFCVLGWADRDIRSKSQPFEGAGEGLGCQGAKRKVKIPKNEKKKNAHTCLLEIYGLQQKWRGIACG